MNISRRAALRGLGATIALPWFESLAFGRAADSAPPRLACFYIPGGINHYAWFPPDTGSGYTLAPSHRPLASLREHFTVLAGLSHIQGRISGHVHPYNWLTGHNINLTPGTITNTISMDQVAARHIGRTYLPSLALSWQDGVGSRTLSRNALGADLPALADYRAVFERLFPPADRAQLREAQERLALDRSILDTAAAGARDLRRRLGAADRPRLDEYLESIREVEKRLDDRHEVLERGRPSFDESSVLLAPQGKNSMREHIELLMDLVVLAFRTDMTRVVTHSLGGEGGPNYAEYQEWARQAGAPLRGAHDYHHKGTGERGPDNPDVRVLGRRDEMLCACLARFMEKLRALPAPEGTLLDYTVILFGGAQITSHSGKSFPLLLAGGRRLGFRHGRHLRWPVDTRPASDLYLTILQRLGCPVTSFKESTGIITELLA
ncbi:MAG TPA: DUF1552 domain-containing protein [Planctomycetota bacterium]|jgi:hypothetical protein|nr:DUF1552 domain-containing protein [Planctomycetota bacterium]